MKPEEPHPRQSYALSPLPACGEGIKGWGAMTVVSITNYADMILPLCSLRLCG